VTSTTTSGGLHKVRLICSGRTIAQGTSSHSPLTIKGRVASNTLTPGASTCQLRDTDGSLRYVTLRVLQRVNLVLGSSGVWTNHYWVSGSVSRYDLATDTWPDYLVTVHVQELKENGLFKTVDNVASQPSIDADEAHAEGPVTVRLSLPPDELNGIAGSSSAAHDLLVPGP
jgi:hypothetical protein